MNDFIHALGDVVSSDTIYESAVQLAAVLAFAAIGEWIAEKAGTLNISVEGMMLAGAFGSAIGYDLTSSIGVGLLFGMAAGAVIAFVHAQMSHRLTADPFVVGLTLNILVVGLTGFLKSELQPAAAKADTVEILGLVDLPYIGRALFGQTWPYYLLYVLIPVAWFIVYRTRWGLEIRAIGEDPQSADVSGIHVNVRRRQALLVCGLCAGLGGGYFVLGQIGRFEDGIVSGQGFIAIVAVIFGGWTLRGTIAGCLLFGLVLSFRLSLPVLGHDFNNELLSSLPFIVTIAAMAVFARRVRQPGALGRPFIRGLR